MTAADPCREFVTPRQVEAGWGKAESAIGEQHNRQANAALLPSACVRIFQSKAST